MVTRVIVTVDTIALCADRLPATFNSGKLCPVQLGPF